MCIAHALQHYVYCSTEYDAPTVSELPLPPFAPPSPLRPLPPPPPLLIYVAARRAAAVTRSFCRDMTHSEKQAGVSKENAGTFISIVVRLWGDQLGNGSSL